MERLEDVEMGKVIFWHDNHAGEVIYYMDAPGRPLEGFNKFFEWEDAACIAREMLNASPEFSLDDPYFWYDEAGRLTSGSAAEAIVACIDDLEGEVIDMLAEEEEAEENLPFAERWQAEAEYYDWKQSDFRFEFEPIQRKK